jgi:nucleoside 2-deoxyribosyltransferase
MKIYWAGPLFTSAERQWNVVMASLLSNHGHEVWLPQAHDPQEKTARSIFAMDKFGIDQAEVIVAVMDGPDPDSGTCWECGYAYALGRPVILVRTDFRNSGDVEDARYNLMLHGSATVNIYLPFESDWQVSQAIANALSKFENENEFISSGRTDRM